MMSERKQPSLSYDPADPYFYSGYAHELEDHDFILDNALPPVLLMSDTGEPQIIEEPWKFFRCENQLQQGSCQGNSLASVCEGLWMVETGASEALDDEDQLSREYAYIASQMEDGIKGDRGSTLSGGMKVALNGGLPKESVAPYQRSYPGWGYITQAMRDAAAAGFKAGSATRLSDAGADKIIAHLNAGGFVHVGVPWNNSFGGSSDVLEDVSTSANGWHAMAIMGLAPKQDAQGRHYSWLFNSHGDGFGIHGFKQLAPQIFDKWCRKSGVEIVGYHPRSKPEPLVINFAKRGYLR